MIPFPFQAAQFGLSNVGNRYLLDGYTSNLWSACSLKRRVSSYAGNSIRVRRSSDSSEADIGFKSDGTLDTDALSSHVGANSGYVVTFYDQSGGGKNFTMATASKQPRIVNAGTYDGKLVFDGTDDGMASGNSGTPSAFTAFLVAKQRSTSGTRINLEHSTNYNTNNAAVAYWDAGAMSIGTHDTSPGGYSRSDFTNKYPNDNVQCYRHDRTQVTSAAMSVLFIGGTKQTRDANGDSGTLPDSTFGALPWYLSSRATTSLYSPLDVYDLVIFEAAKSDADVAAISGILAL